MNKISTWTALLAVSLSAACGTSSGAGAPGGALDGSAESSGSSASDGASSVNSSSDGPEGTVADGAGIGSSDSADGILTNFTGSRTGTDGTFSSATFSHGFATYVTGTAGTRTLTVFFTDYASPCSFASMGAFLDGGHTFAMAISLAGQDVQSMTEYQSPTALEIEDAPVHWVSGVNCLPAPDAGVHVVPPVPSSSTAGGAMIVYSFAATRVTGHFVVPASGTSGELDGIFDVPICNFPVIGGDAGVAAEVCIPPIPGTPISTAIAPCSGIAPTTAGGGTLTGVTGTRSGPDGAFPSATFNTGYASIEAATLYPSSYSTTLYLNFADYAQSCGYGLLGASATGGHAFLISATQASSTGPVALTPGTYTEVFSYPYPQLWTAASDGECSNATPTSVHATGDTVVVTAIDAAHVTGTFQLGAVGTAGAAAGTFDLPICNPPSYAGGPPQVCCK